MTYQLWLGDCLEEMSRIEDGSVDMILADLPYGTTACKWDVVIPFEPLWKQYKRVIKRSGAVVLFGSEPFSSLLRLSNLDWYKYDWVWDKVATSSGLNAKVEPLRCHENIIIFCKGSPLYTPQMTTGKQWHRGGSKRIGAFTNYASQQGVKQYRVNSSDIDTTKYPKTILTISNADKSGQQHPTQKPVALLSYLIKTYTNPGELVLDNTCGSGSTLEAAELNGRNSIGIEKDAGYFEIARNRLEQVTKRLSNQDLPMFAEVTP